MNNNIPRTMTDMIKSKKDLIKKRDTRPEMAQAINVKIQDLDAKIMARVARNDQNFLRVFFKTAKELIDPNDFAKVEDVASTRCHQYQSGNTACN